MLKYSNPENDNCIIGGEPDGAESFILQQVAHYAGVTKHENGAYSEDAVLASLTNKYPVFLAGAQNHNVFKSHGWVVSGVFNSGSSTYNTWYRMITYTL